MFGVVDPWHGAAERSAAYVAAGRGARRLCAAVFDRVSTTLHSYRSAHRVFERSDHDGRWSDLARRTSAAAGAHRSDRRDRRSGPARGTGAPRTRSGGSIGDGVVRRRMGCVLLAWQKRWSAPESDHCELRHRWRVHDSLGSFPLSYGHAARSCSSVRPDFRRRHFGARVRRLVPRSPAATGNARSVGSACRAHLGRSWRRVGVGRTTVAASVDRYRHHRAEFGLRLDWASRTETNAVKSTHGLDAKCDAICGSSEARDVTRLTDPRVDR